MTCFLLVIHTFFSLLQNLPLGDWHCPNCTCKFCGTIGENVTEEGGGTASELMMCSLCEKKCNYHSIFKDPFLPSVFKWLLLFF